MRSIKELQAEASDRAHDARPTLVIGSFSVVVPGKEPLAINRLTETGEVQPVAQAVRIVREASEQEWRQGIAREFPNFVIDETQIPNFFYLCEVLD